jgi:hypothetical protein
VGHVFERPRQLGGMSSGRPSPPCGTLRTDSGFYRSVATALEVIWRRCQTVSTTGGGPLRDLLSRAFEGTGATVRRGFFGRMPRHEGLEPRDPVLQVVGFHMRVPHRGGQVRVSKELLSDARAARAADGRRARGSVHSEFRSRLTGAARRRRRRPRRGVTGRSLLTTHSLAARSARSCSA